MACSAVAWGWITEHATVLSTVVSAVATFVIAWFTTKLSVATQGLKDSAEAQVAEAKALRKIAETQSDISAAQTDILIMQKEIARQQFLVEHRPKLRVRHVSINDPGPFNPEDARSFFHHGGKIDGGLVVVNIGGTKAKIIETRYRIFFSRTGLPVSAPYDMDFRDNLLIKDQILDAGESCATPIADTIVMEPAPTGPSAFERNGWKIYVMGQIRYQDEGDADRFMGFCRLREDNGRFLSVSDQDYEYED